MILIAGNCVIENYETLKETVEVLLEEVQDKEIDFYFKSSFKKDNRTSIKSFSGLEEDKALELLAKIKKEYNVKVCTDVHNTEQVDKLDFIDMIQIPAFLAKQRSLLEKVSMFAEDRKIHIKKPQFIPPDEISFICETIEKHNRRKDNIIITDRGTLLGYDKYFIDPRHTPIMKRHCNNIVWDITHPTKNQKFKNDVLTLGLSGIASGASGLFIETHPNCDKALCDNKTMLPLSEIKELISKTYNLWRFLK
ncbi:MAG: 3-deoxy-8-phosphooctulonate synthase [Candidatus Omnitrophica bacterium]|nr:3-deoxy-8-phosphooctulonate synthase [Candidatus Omnitrophota bacterium]